MNEHTPGLRRRPIGEDRHRQAGVLPDPSVIRTLHCPGASATVPSVVDSKVTGVAAVLRAAIRMRGRGNSAAAGYSGIAGAVGLSRGSESAVQQRLLSPVTRPVAGYARVHEGTAT